MLMLAPLFDAVRLFVAQICLPTAASRQTSSPKLLALYSYSSRSTAVDVLLKTRLEGERISGQRKRGWSEPTSSIRPLTSNRFPWKTGVAAESLPLVVIGSRQKMCPFAGSRDARELLLQTINCLLPPTVIIIGELLETGSSSAFQTSLPVCLSNARRLAPGFAPVTTISNTPSTRGEGRHDISATWYSFPIFFSQITVPVFTSRQCV